MRPNRALRELGQSLWLDNITRSLLDSGAIARDIDQDAVTGLDGWVSLEVSPLLAHDTASTFAAARSLHEEVARPNLMIKVPGTAEGLAAIETCIAEGIAVNVTLLFSASQYRAAADAYLRGIERRNASGLDPAVGSVAPLAQNLRVIMGLLAVWEPYQVGSWGPASVTKIAAPHRWHLPTGAR